MFSTPMSKKKYNVSSHHRKKKFKVVLAVEAAKGYTPGYLQGIKKYHTIHAAWDTYLLHIQHISEIFKSIESWEPDGLIIFYPYEKNLEKLLSLEIPFIIGESRRENSDLHPNYTTCSDDFSTGAMAAKYYLEKGDFRSYVFFGYKNERWSQKRYEGYCQVLEAEGLSVSAYKRNCTRIFHREKKELVDIANWLKELALPAAVFACNDRCARDILESCRLAGLQVPADVAVLGADNDQIECSLLPLSLSSICYDSERVGYEVAELLEKLMSGQKVGPNKTIVASPKYIIERQSTDIFHIEDKDVSSAIKYIRKHCDKILSVSDVHKHVAMSRRSLELKFDKFVGRTIYEEICTHHARYIAKLLIDTNMPICKIAMHIGYNTDHNISRFFKKATNYTPQEYRNKFGYKKTLQTTSGTSRNRVFNMITADIKRLR